MTDRNPEQSEIQEQDLPPWALWLRSKLLIILRILSWGIHTSFVVISVAILTISGISFTIGSFELFTVLSDTIHRINSFEIIRIEILGVIQWYLLAVFSYLLAISLFKAFSLPWEHDPTIPNFFDINEFSDLETRLVGIIILFIGLTLVNYILPFTSDLATLELKDLSSFRNLLWTYFPVISGFLIILGLSLYIYLVE